ncbi:hypothetical protein, partial [Pseudarthrobacter sp. NKDBFgelt]
SVDVSHLTDAKGRWLPLPEKQPIPWARLFLRDYFETSEGALRLAFWRDQWWVWTGSVWQQTKKCDIEGAIYQAFTHAQVQTKSARDISDGRPFACDSRKVELILDALRAFVRLSDEVEPFQWFERCETDPDPRNLIACRNGLYDLARRRLHAPDRRFMATSVADWAYEPGREQLEFNRFLSGLWPKDDATRAFLQEVVGYMLSGHRSLHKIPVLIGPTRSGKSLILNLLGKILGPDLAVTLGTAAIGETFGLQGVIGRRLAAVADMRLKRQVDHGALAERLLTFSGE